jgi:hypothetical protein
VFTDYFRKAGLIVFGEHVGCPTTHFNFVPWHDERKCDESKRTWRKGQAQQASALSRTCFHFQTRSFSSVRECKVKVAVDIAMLLRRFITPVEVANPRLFFHKPKRKSPTGLVLAFLTSTQQVQFLGRNFSFRTPIRIWKVPAR